MNTNFLSPTAIFGNGNVTGNEWQDVSNIFYVDQDYALSNASIGSASDFTISNFNFNIPVGSTINGIEIEIIGKRGAQTSPVITLDVNAYNNVNGADDYYTYPGGVTTLTESDSTVVIGGSTFLFSHVWTVDEINNLKLNFEANGDISLDSVLVKVYYIGPGTLTIDYNTLVGGPFQVGEEIIGTLSGASAIIVTDNGSNSMTVTNVVGFFQDGETITGQTSGATALINSPIPGLCIDCSSPIQVQAMYLELPFQIGQTKFYLKKGSFVYPNGIPVQPGDIGSCGGTIPFVFDESKSKADGQNFEENAMLDTNNGGVWTVLASGVIEVDLGSVTQRGLDYKAPGGHVANNMSDHDANSKVIISNNEPYNLTLVRRCQVDTVFSPPIEIDWTDISNVNHIITTSLHLLKFLGEGVTAILNSAHTVYATITDRFSRISSNDTTSGYLNDKQEFVSSDNTVLITPTIQNPGGNEKLSYDFSVTGASSGDGKVFVDNADTTKSFLDDKINLHSSDSSVSVIKTITNPAGNEVLDYNLKVTGGASVSFSDYKFDDTVGGTPAAGFITYDDATPSLVTQVNVNNVDGSAVNNAGQFSFFSTGDKISIADDTTPGLYATYIIVSLNNTGTVTEFTVTYDSSSGTFTDLDDVTVTLIHGTGVGNVIEVQNNGSSLGNFTKLNFKPGSVATDAGGGQADIDATGGSGGIGVLTSQFLPIGTDTDPAGSGTLTAGGFAGTMFTNVGTNRIYVTILTQSSSTSVPTNKLRIFKNDFGSYYQEGEIQITRAMLTNTSSAFRIDSMTTWTTDGSYLYAIQKYFKTSGGNETRIDVIRFDLDGTNNVATNIYSAATTSINQRIDWVANSFINAQAATVVSSDLYITWCESIAGIYTDQLRKFTISGTTYTPAATYTRTGSIAYDGAFSLTYNSNNSTFYLSGGNTGDDTNGKTTQKFTISASNFVGGADNTYDQFSYGTIGYNSNGDAKIGFLDFSASSYIIYVVQVMKIENYGGTSSTENRSFWLTSYNFPIF